MSIIHQYLFEIHKNWLHNFALIYYGIQRISHLVRNCRVNQTQKLTFCLWSIVENFLRNVYKADHNILFLIRKRFDLTLFYLEELELWNEFIFNTFHAVKISDYSFDLVLMTATIIFQILFGKVPFECKDFLAEITRRDHKQFP